jgi:uncharacterized SAM-binding protein YcdF (DUF218 family)
VSAFVLATGAAYVFRGPILIAIGKWFVVDEPAVAGDFIYLLNGDEHTRPFHAAQLYAQGLAPRIVVAREEPRRAEAMGLAPNGTAVSVEVMRRLGVPDSAITVIPVPGGVTSTHDEGEVLLAYLKEHPAKRVLVVTSMFHTRRAQWTFGRVLGDFPVDVRMVAAPDERFDETNWWQHEQGLLRYNEEIVKFVHTVLLR